MSRVDLSGAGDKLKSLEKKEPKWLKDFKDFINKGSVMDLAVGVIIGGAFSQIVTSLVNDIFMPVIGLVAGGVDFTELSVDIPNFFGADTSAHIAYGNFIQNVVDFLLVALCVFFFIRVLSKMQAKAKERLRKEEEAEKKAEEEKEDEQTKLLKEILKELKKK